MTTVYCVPATRPTRDTLGVGTTSGHCQCCDRNMLFVRAKVEWRVLMGHPWDDARDPYAWWCIHCLIAGGYDVVRVGVPSTINVAP